jgi:hypothetical protein
MHAASSGLLFHFPVPLTFGCSIQFLPIINIQLCSTEVRKDALYDFKVLKLFDNSFHIWF